MPSLTPVHPGSARYLIGFTRGPSIPALKDPNFLPYLVKSQRRPKVATCGVGKMQVLGPPRRLKRCCGPARFTLVARAPDGCRLVQYVVFRVYAAALAWHLHLENSTFKALIMPGQLSDAAMRQRFLISATLFKLLQTSAAKLEANVGRCQDAQHVLVAVVRGADGRQQWLSMRRYALFEDEYGVERQQKICRLQ